MIKNTLTSRLLFWFVLLSVFPLVIFSIYSYSNNTKVMIESSLHKLHDTSNLEKMFIENWFSYRKADISYLSESSNTKNFMRTLNMLYEVKERKGFTQSYVYVKAVGRYEKDFLSLQRHYPYIKDLFLIDRDGNVLYSIEKKDTFGKNIHHEKYVKTRFALAYKKTREDKQIHFSDLEFDADGKIAGYITSPVLNEEGLFIGVLAIKFHWEEFKEILKEEEHHENYLLGFDGILRTSINEDKRALEYTIDLKTFKTQKDSLRVQQKIKIYDTEWLLVNELDGIFLNNNKQFFASSLLVFLLIVVIFVVITSRYLSLKITKPLRRLSLASQDYVKGKRSLLANDAKDKEIYELTEAFNSMLKSLTENENMLNEYTLELEKKVEKELEKNTLQQQRLFAQTRLAQMGEMISMIAHQWRQPLGAISATNIDLKMKLELEIYDLEKQDEREKCREYFSQSFNHVELLVKSLTTTIDDFRNFYKPNKIRKETEIHTTLEKALKIIEASLHNDHIIIKKEFLSQKIIQILDGEVMQVFLNIFKNAQDNFKQHRIQNPSILIVTKDTLKGVTIHIKDNGGGIPTNVMDKIFNPYFSTKNEKNGTGLGLYMSKIIIEDHHRGSLRADNLDDGVEFIIELEHEKE